LIAERSDPMERDLGIKTWAAGSGERLGALVWSGALVVIMAIVTPFASRPLPRSLPLLGSLLTATVMGIAITGILLAFQARTLRSMPTAVLATGFFYAAATIVPYMLLYPGLYPPLVAALHGSMATISFLWFSAHIGLLASIVAFFQLRRAKQNDATMRRDGRRFIGAAAIVYVVVTSVAIWSRSLPGGYADERLTPFFVLVLAPVVAVLAVVAIVQAIQRGARATVLDCWLGVVGLAMLVEIAVAIAGHTRFTVGWYTAAVTLVLSTLALLAMMLRQAATRYVELFERARVLENEAHTDTLTGLPNRRRFDEEFIRAFGGALRRDSPLAIAIVDIDRFKLYNDAFGHQAGDQALRRIGNVIADSVGRSGDFAARYGGEEFVVILEDTLLDGATGVAERIRTAVLEAGLQAPGGAMLTVSVGVAARRPGESAPDVLRHADEALYYAKDAGRNRVAVWTNVSLA
jgi:diguanylate cyclase (GGDEF)-like protein